VGCTFVINAHPQVTLSNDGSRFFAAAGLAVTGPIGEFSTRREQAFESELL